MGFGLRYDNVLGLTDSHDLKYVHPQGLPIFGRFILQGGTLVPARRPAFQGTAVTFDHYRSFGKLLKQVQSSARSMQPRN